MPTPTTWSHSQISTLFECGERYRLEKVARAPRLPAWWFVSGTAFHRATEQFDRDYFRGEVLTVGQVLDLWTVAFAEEVKLNDEIESDRTKWMRGGRATKSAPNKEDGEFLYEQGKIWVANYRDWRLANPHLVSFDLPDGEPAIEVEYTVTIADQPIRGGIDRVFIDTLTGIPIVVDHKTGSRRPDTDDQLSEYAHAFKILFGVDIQYGAYYMAREGRLSEPVPLSLSLPAFEKAIRGATVMRENKVYVPRRSRNCVACGVNRFCAAYGGADAALYEGIDE